MHPLLPEFLLTSALTCWRLLGSLRSNVLRRIEGIPCLFVEFLQKVLRLMGQFIRHLYHQRYIVVAPNIPVAQGRNTLAFQAHLRVVWVPAFTS